ncbi:hypothetical protein ACFL3M_02880, partial [Patescibacteria group bacterium]
MLKNKQYIFLLIFSFSLIITNVAKADFEEWKKEQESNPPPESGFEIYKKEKEAEGLNELYDETIVQGETENEINTATENVENLYRNDEYNFRIKFPLGWDIKDGDGKYVVKKAVKDGASVLVLVNDVFLDSILTAEERQALSDEDIQSMELSIFSDEEVSIFLDTLIAGQLEAFPGSTILEKGVRYVDNRKAAYFKMNQVYKVQDSNIEGIAINYFTIHKGKVYQIGGFYPTVPINESKEELIINTSLATFVFEDWNDKTIIQNKNNDNFDNDLFRGKLSGWEIFLTLITNIVFTWVFGLMIPILLRFVFLKRPLSKSKSFLIVFILWFAQLIFYITLNPESKTHNALVLVAIVSYLILKFGLPDENNSEMIRFCKKCGNKINNENKLCQECQSRKYKRIRTRLNWRDFKVLLPGVVTWIIGRIIGGGEEIILTAIGKVAFIGGVIALG